MAYIHSCGIFHRDLSARNILVDGKNSAKVADFGLARDLQYSAETKSLQAIPWK
jgi:serine/threonine protein kinase